MYLPLTESQLTNAQQTAVERWSLSRRIALRFAFFVPWVGKNVLGLSQEISGAETGSGNKLFNYVQVVCFLAVSTLATGVWSAVDARRAQYAKLYEWLRVYVRYALAMTMLAYGMAKLFKSQFPFPSMDRLMKPYGEDSPMGLLWTFMGYSKAYNIFTGGAEALGGLLLFFRRTTTLGALIVVGVMSNVVMLNFTYDVPVKLFSSHLLLMGVFLLLPDLRRLAHFLVLNRPTEPAVLRTPFEPLWVERGSRR